MIISGRGARIKLRRRIARKTIHKKVERVRPTIPNRGIYGRGSFRGNVKGGMRNVAKQQRWRCRPVPRTS